ncbi:MAG: dUTP diphosphatase [Flavobacteriaceae bacterium]|jgi:dUTP pyrophosphatase
MIEIPVLFTGKGELPEHATPLSAGMDLRAHIEEPIILNSLERKIIPTGLSIALPEGYEAQVRPRSGLAAKHGITVLNAPGTIDADYRGDIGVILVNLSQEPFSIAPQERIAQLVVTQYSTVRWKPVVSLPTSQRGSGGFGSTGKK